jgi:hypothetical protein
LVVPVKCDHFKVLSIDIKSTYPINDVPYPIKPSMIVPLYGFTHQEILSEYEEDNIVGFDYIGVIERIYTANGDEIEPARFDEYAYFRTRGNAVQLTDKVEPGYKIQLHLYYERDNVTSNTFTIEVS